MRRVFLCATIAVMKTNNTMWADEQTLMIKLTSGTTEFFGANMKENALWQLCTVFSLFLFVLVLAACSTAIRCLIKETVTIELISHCTREHSSLPLFFLPASEYHGVR